MKFIASIQPFSKKCLLKNHWNQNSPLSKGKIFKQQTPFYMQTTHLTDLDIQLISNYFDSLKKNNQDFGCLSVIGFCFRTLIAFVFVVCFWSMSSVLIHLFISSDNVSLFLGLILTILFFGYYFIADILNSPSNKEIELEKNEALRIILESNKKIILTDTIIANFTSTHTGYQGVRRDSYYFKVEKLGSLDSIREKISHVGSLTEGEKLYFHIVHYDFLNNKSRTGLFPHGHFIFKIETFDEQHDVSEIIGIGQVMNSNFIPESEWHN